MTENDWLHGRNAQGHKLIGPPKNVGGRYVNITYKPAGATRQQSSWAVRLGERTHKFTGTVFVSYFLCNREGVVGKSWEKKGTIHEQKTLLLALDRDVVERPAMMNLHYGELEIVTEMTR